MLAITKKHHALVGLSAKPKVAESLDLDEALRAHHPNDPRWDYLLGVVAEGVEAHVVGLEPHSAETAEVKTVIAKRKAALAQLDQHLRPKVKVKKWLWVASGGVDFVPHDKVLLRLAQAGIEFVGKQLEARHLVPREAKRHRAEGPSAENAPGTTVRKPGRKRRSRQ
jgi:hypothetical protein